MNYNGLYGLQKIKTKRFDVMRLTELQVRGSGVYTIPTWLWYVAVLTSPLLLIISVIIAIKEIKKR